MRLISLLLTEIWEKKFKKISDLKAKSILDWLLEAQIAGGYQRKLIQ